MPDRPSLKTLEQAITDLEQQYGRDVAPAEQGRQEATLVFLGGLKELVRAFCLQGCVNEDDCSYIPFSLRDK